MPIYIGSVPTEHLDTFDTKLKASFERIVEEGIDVERMSMVISRDERQVYHTTAFTFPRMLMCSFFTSYAADSNHRRGMYFLAQ